MQFEKRYRMYGSFFQTKLCLALSSLELAQRPESEGVDEVLDQGRPQRDDFGTAIREMVRAA